MPISKESLKERLARYRQIKISVIGRKSGQTVSIPVWFVLEGENLYLLPVQGSDTSVFYACHCVGLERVSFLDQLGHTLRIRTFDVGQSL
jgi:hypothetical protein